MGRLVAGVDDLEGAAVVAPKTCARTSTLPAGDALRTEPVWTEMCAGGTVLMVGEVTVFGGGDRTTTGDVKVRKVAGVDSLEDTPVVEPNDWARASTLPAGEALRIGELFPTTGLTGNSADAAAPEVRGCSGPAGVGEPTGVELRATGRITLLVGLATAAGAVAAAISKRF